MAATLRQDLATPLFADVDLLGMLPYKGKIDSLMRKTEIVQAIASLRARGSDAHLWLPGGDVRTYGPELVSHINSSTWSADAGWTISGSSATHAVNASGGYISCTGVYPVVGRTYEFTLTVSGYSGGSAAVIGAFYSPQVNFAANGTYTFSALCISALMPFSIYGGTTFVGSISNISVREITSITPTITSGLTTGNYLESTGNTLATVDNPTGLVLDALGTVGGELFTSYSRNSTVETGTSGFPAVCTASAISAVVGIYKAGTANTPYRCSISWSGNVAGKPVLVGGGVALVTVSSAVSGSAEVTVVPSIANIYVYFASSAAGQSISIDSFSAKPISGIHLTQGTTANKPLLRRGLTNLLTYSSDFSQWIKQTGVTLGTNVADPSGGNAAITVNWSGCAVGQGLIRTGAATVAGAVYTRAVWVKADSAGTVLLKDPAITSGTSTLTLSDQWQLVLLSESNAGVLSGVWLAKTALSPATVYVYSAGVFAGTLTAAQILAAGGIPVTTTAAASNPDAGKYSWSFDSTDVLSATIPAGWETATVIDAAPTGAVASVQNVVGTHSIRGAMVTGVNLVTNGGFDTDTTGWTASTATLSIVSGALQVEWLSGVSYAKQIIPTVVGLTYQLNIKFIKGTAINGTIYCGPTAGTSTYVSSSPSADSDLSFTFTATSTTAHLQLYCGTNSAGNNSRYDNISVYEINPVTHARILVKGTLTDAETNLYKSLANSFK